MKNLLLLLKIILCFLFTLYWFYCSILFTLGPITNPEEFDLQILFYIIFSIFIIIYTWRIPFVKTKTITKLIFLVSFITYFYIPQILPSIDHQWDKAICAEVGVCKEGLKIITEHGEIKINKENCLKYNWEWDEDRKSCFLNK